jgi:xylose isomerase
MTDANTIALALAIEPTDPDRPLGMSICLDGEELYRTDAVTARTVLHKFLPDLDGEHELKIELHGKTADHAHLDANGEFEYDSCLKIDAVEFDDVNVMPVFQTLAQYQHNFNGIGETVTEHCYGVMGCNGTVTLKFSTPIYLWLLEHM